MRKYIMLRTRDGRRISVALDHWGGGIDRYHRRWTREADGWHCADTRDVARLEKGSFLTDPLRALGLLRH